MRRFLSRNVHWILFIFVMINLIIGFTNFTYSKQAIIAMIFGVVGLLGVIYLAFHIEAQKRREQEEK